MNELNEINSVKSNYISAIELIDAVQEIKVSRDNFSPRETQMMRLLDTAIFHIKELKIGSDKTREDLNKSLSYADNLRKELKNLLDVALSYIQESSKVKEQLDQLTKEFNYDQKI